MLRGEVKLALAVLRLQPISSRKEKRNGLLPTGANYDKRLFMSCAPAQADRRGGGGAALRGCSTTPPWWRWRSPCR